MSVVIAKRMTIRQKSCCSDGVRFVGLDIYCFFVCTPVAYSMVGFRRLLMCLLADGAHTESKSQNRYR
jgi:hypothetical protein